MRRLLIILALFVQIHTTLAYNPIWVNADKRIILKIVKLDKNNPRSIEQFFLRHKCESKKENLGFGWTMWSPAIGVGYISISAKLYYYHDTIVSYTLVPELPTENGLISKYKKWYGNCFMYSNSSILPFDYNPERLGSALAEYRGGLNPKTLPIKLLQYMSPKSGTEYVINGNYGAEIPENRKGFSEIKDSLSNDKIVLLMYSINPASRFRAIEYYFKNKENFSDTANIDKWVDRNFEEIPEVEVLMSCTISYLSSTWILIKWYSEMYENK